MTCPNCGRELDSTASMCTNCGWERDSSTVWPPSIAHDVPPPVKSVNWVRVTFQVVGGLVLGAAFTFFGTVLLLIGPIIVGAMYFSSRKNMPYFANGLAAGFAVGMIGVVACFAGLRGWN